MKKKEIISLVCFGIALGLLIPMDAFATKTTGYGGKEIAKIGTDLKDLMFNIAVPYTAGIFGGYNTVKSFMSNNYQAMGAFALLTASSFVMPPFLNGIFGSSMLLP